MNPNSDAFKLAEIVAEVLVTQGSNAAHNTMISSEIWAELPYWGKLAVKETAIMLAKEKGWSNNDSR